jgi:predicted pyridoxine 5'-phosphate oxidase superfamily flavin-nucleotide-binding protein
LFLQAEEYLEIAAIVPTASRPQHVAMEPITDELREFLAAIDTSFLATASADGEPYVQHRGGPRGFIRALDDHTLGFPDLAGNRQYLTVGNLAENDRVCLFLIDYARQRRVKVWGRARVVPPEPALVASLGPLPPRARVERVVLITVERWDVNCPAHIPRKVNVEDLLAAGISPEAVPADGRRRAR